MERFVQFWTSRSGLVKPCKGQEDTPEGQFWASRSGYVKPREGLAGGWLVIAFVAILLLIGAVSPAQAWSGNFYCCNFAPPEDYYTCCNLEIPCTPGDWRHWRDTVYLDYNHRCWLVSWTCSCF